MQLNHRPTKILITGKSGTGKTTYFERYLLNTDHSRVFVFDHQGEFTYRHPEVPLIESSSDLDKALEDFRFICYDPSKDFAGDLQSGFDFFCEWVFSYAKDSENSDKETKILACDELQMLLGTDKLSHECAMVLETGRRYGLDFLAVSQQPNLLHNRVRNQTTEIVTFQQTDKLVVDVMEEWGFDPAQLRNLEIGQYLVNNTQTGATASGNLFAKGS